jgi:hypothetical protein
VLVLVLLLDFDGCSLPIKSGLRAGIVLVLVVVVVLLVGKAIDDEDEHD